MATKWELYQALKTLVEAQEGTNQFDAAKRAAKKLLKTCGPEAKSRVIT